jgi:hypothetical protein
MEQSKFPSQIKLGTATHLQLLQICELAWIVVEDPKRINQDPIHQGTI